MDYAAQFPAFRQAIADFLGGHKEQGRKIAVYGAGARVFCLMNFAGMSPYIDFIVDDQREKQNTFMPGGRIPVRPSEALYTEPADICLLAVNTENEDKVIARHQKWIEGGGTFWSVLPPSDRLLPVWDASPR
jgi:hypothetical protein